MLSPFFITQLSLRYSWVPLKRIKTINLSSSAHPAVPYVASCVVGSFFCFKKSTRRRQGYGGLRPQKVLTKADRRALQIP
jgi:hypothetical protein